MSTSHTVGFDGLFHEHPASGSGQYALNLWRELGSRPLCDLRFRLLAPDPAKRLHGKVRKLAWEQVGLPRASRSAGVDLVHVPYFSAPLAQRTRYVTTIHDVIPLVMPEYGGTRQMRWYLRLVRRAVGRCAMVVTDSNHSRDDIIKHLGLRPERVVAIPLGVSNEYSPPMSLADEESVARTRERFGLRRPFVLNVGGFDLRKGLPQLIRGFALAIGRLEGDYDLVIVGSPHSGNQRLFPPVEPLLAELGIADRVRLVGFVSEADKRDLYRAAEVFAFSSIYEGFGLDPLEAMACGAPVVCSDRTSLPEVVGDAALLVEPEAKALAEALVRMLESPDLRAELSLRGRRRAAEFTWKRTADATIDVYRRVLGLPTECSACGC
jgi:glycosyltransferase involved in cell wall biosynthesis